MERPEQVLACRECTCNGSPDIKATPILLLFVKGSAGHNGHACLRMRAGPRPSSPMYPSVLPLVI